MNLPFCYLPNSSQQAFAAYLSGEYGEIVKFNYLTVATRPAPKIGKHTFKSTCPRCNRLRTEVRSRLGSKKVYHCWNCEGKA